MATIKSYTDIKQSKELAKILPITSIDFAWNIFSDGSTRLLRMDDWEVSENAKSNVEIIPCWSLAALLSILPNNEHITTSVSRGSWQIEPINYLPNTWWCGYEDDESLTEFNVSADNPIDACYEMIIKLNKQNLI